MKIHLFTLDKMSSPVKEKLLTGSGNPAFEGLEPYAGKLASPVLRGQRAVRP